MEKEKHPITVRYADGRVETVPADHFGPRQKAWKSQRRPKRPEVRPGPMTPPRPSEPWTGSEPPPDWWVDARIAFLSRT